MSQKIIYYLYVCIIIYRLLFVSLQCIKTN